MTLAHIPTGDPTTTPVTTPAEAPLTLDQPAVRVHGFRDHLGLWSSFGISLLIPVVVPFFAPTSFVASLAAVVIGTVAGCALLGAVAAIGARTGAPAMVVFRGLFGRSGSWVPTALNIAQCLGWAVFEIWIIAHAAATVWPSAPAWLVAVVAGALATAMALRPLGSTRLLRRIAIVVVVACSAYFLVSAASKPLGDLGAGGWHGLWTNVDLVASMSISWIPLVADYTRHARVEAGGDRSTGIAVGLGYGVASAAFFLVGVLGLLAYSPADGDILGALLAVPAGAVALAILAADEIDQAFANIYSTAVSVQNVVSLDRRWLALGIGAVATALGAVIADGYAYEGFLLLIGAVFTPLGAVLVVDFWIVRRGRYDVSASASGRPWLFVPWLAGVAAFELISPTYVDHWSAWHDAWSSAQQALGIPADLGWSAVVTSFVVAGLLTLLVGARRRERLASAA